MDGQVALKPDLTIKFSLSYLIRWFLFIFYSIIRRFYNLSNYYRLISFVQPRELKLGLRNSSKQLSLLVIHGFKISESKHQCVLLGFPNFFFHCRWAGLTNFLGKDRTPIYCGSDKTTKGFVKSYKNLNFYWILGAGHFVSQHQSSSQWPY